MDNKLDAKIALLKELAGSKPMVCVTYRSKEADGKREIAIGVFEFADEENKCLHISCGMVIPFSDIIDLDGEMFRK